MSSPSCLISDCMSFYNTYKTCTGSSGGTLFLTQAMTECLCKSPAVEQYKTCYPCLITDSGYESSVTPDGYTYTCYDLSNGFWVPLIFDIPTITNTTITSSGSDTTSDASGTTPNSTGTPSSNGASNSGGSSSGGISVSNSDHTLIYAGIVLLAVGIALISGGFFIIYRRKRKISVGSSHVYTTNAGPLAPPQITEVVIENGPKEDIEVK